MLNGPLNLNFEGLGYGFTRFEGGQMIRDLVSFIKPAIPFGCRRQTQPMPRTSRSPQRFLQMG